MFSRTAILFGSLLAVGLGVFPTRADGQDSRYWVRVDAGTFRMGATKEADPRASHDEAPVNAVTLDAFDIGRYEVTVGEFAEFVDAGGYTDETLRPLWDFEAFGERNQFGRWKSPENWDDQRPYSNRPVIGVSWFEAIAYCRWRSRREGQRITLPTEAQWERAARGTDARLFPWGNDAPTATLDVNFGGRVGQLADVGSHPQGDTPGVNPISDLAGNAWEWCLDSLTNYRVAAGPGNGLRGLSGQYRVLRGGSFGHDGRDIRCARRFGAAPEARGGPAGFRLARAASA